MSTQASSIPAQSPMKAIAFMVAAGFINTIMLSSVKQLADDLHPFEIAFFRCMIGFLVLLPVVWQAGGVIVLRTQNIGLHLLRGVLNAGGMLLFFLALSLDQEESCNNLF